MFKEANISEPQVTLVNLEHLYRMQQVSASKILLDKK